MGSVLNICEDCEAIANYRNKISSVLEWITERDGKCYVSVLFFNQFNYSKIIVYL